MKILKIQYFGELFRNAVKRAPVEMLVALFFMLAAIVSLHEDLDHQEWLWSFPSCFCIIYAIGKWTAQRGRRWIYYFSVLTVPGFWMWNPEFGNPLFLITFFISQLLVLLSGGTKDNDGFVQNGLCYLRDMAGALLLAFVGWVLAFSIYQSVVYIFDLTHSYNFVIYAAQVAWIFVAPVFFLMFNTRPGQYLSANRFLGILSDFIISPALLIYNLILYLYFIKIAILWSLPKGGVAYMVLSFVLGLLIMKGVQTVLKERYYIWYYKRFSYWILPALIVLWISVGYRVWEYGWTTWRGYLFLIACLASVAMVLFFVSRWGKYRLMAGITLGVLAFFSYLPGINVRQWGIYSQEKRIKSAVRELYTESDKQWKVTVDSLTLSEYRTLYHSSKYVQEVKGREYMKESFGFSYTDLDSIVPYSVREKLENNRWNRYRFYVGWNGGEQIDVSGYSALEMIGTYSKNNNIYYDLDGEELTIIQGKDVLIKVNINEMFREKLRASGIDLRQSVIREQLESIGKDLFTYPVGNRLIIFEAITVDGESVTFTGGRPYWLLTK